MAIRRGTQADRPDRRFTLKREDVAEIGVSAIGAAAAVWIPFHLAGWDAPVGFALCFLIGFFVIYGAVAVERHGLLEAKDRIARAAISVGAMLTLVPLFLIIYFVLSKGLPAVLSKFPHFLTHDLKGVPPDAPVSKAGVLHAIVGTVEQVGIGAGVTVPIGILAATYLNEVKGRFAGVVRAIADAMTGLPTIIAGLFIYFRWVVPRQGSGQSGFAAALALSIIMLPTVVRTAEEVLRIVSDHLREAALALGAPQWRMTLMVVLPTARAGLITASILGVARAVGETAPVLLTAGSSPATNPNPLAHPQSDLPIQLFQFIRSTERNNITEAWGAALVLVSIVLLLFVLARMLGAREIGAKKRRFRIFGPSRRSRNREATDNSPTVNLGDNRPFISTA